MTFVQVLEKTAVLACFEKLESRFKDIAKSTSTLQYILLSYYKRKKSFNLFLDIKNLLK